MKSNRVGARHYRFSQKTIFFGADLGGEDPTRCEMVSSGIVKRH